MKSITEFKKGDRVRIILSECVDDLQSRLADLGLFAGAEIGICKNDNHGPLLIGVFNSKVVLGREEAEKIYGEKI